MLSLLIYMYELDIQDKHTLPKWNILSKLVYEQREQATITAIRQNISEYFIYRSNLSYFIFLIIKIVPITDLLCCATTPTSVSLINNPTFVVWFFTI